VPDFILLMHNDATTEPTPEMWSSYFSHLRNRSVFEGGSAIGAGETFRKQATPDRSSEHLTGYIRVQAENLKEASSLLAGNPVFECGGTVEIRELPRS
jgi:hypothetical protein